MARLLFGLHLNITPDSNPDTLLQIVAPTNQRVVIHSIAFDPEGDTPADKPMKFDIVTQADAGGLVSASSNLVKVSPPALETIQATVLRWTGSAAEPSTPVTQYTFSLHQQASRVWPPDNPFREIIIPGGSRYGLRYLGGPASFKALNIRVSLEE